MIVSKLPKRATFKLPNEDLKGRRAHSNKAMLPKKVTFRIDADTVGKRRKKGRNMFHVPGKGGMKGAMRRM